MGIFQDYDDIYNSNPQIAQLGGIPGNNLVFPGDLKFKDINNDGVINRFDYVRKQDIRRYRKLPMVLHWE